MNIRSKAVAVLAITLLATGSAFAENPHMKSPPFYPSMIQGTPHDPSFAFRHTANHDQFATRARQSGNQQQADSVQDSHSMVQAGERNRSTPASAG